jgi:glycine cleavage system H protein
MEYPKTYRYTKDDEWIEAKGQVGTIGLTHEAQCRLGDIVYLELPEVGRPLEAGKPLGVVESVKAVFEIYSPVSGEVVEVNTELRDAPEKVNSDPHGAGWLVKVRLKNPAEMEALMDAAAYEAFAAQPSRESSH